MFFNYLKIAFRTILKNKLFAFINVVGLSIGIAVCAMIMFYVQQERTFDGSFANSERIFRVVEIQDWGSTTNHVSFTMGPLAPAMMEEIPEVEIAARIMRSGEQLVSYENINQFIKNTYVADENYLKVFNHEVIAGNAETALQGPDKVVLSQTTTRQIFGNEDPLGKTFAIGQNENLIVTGIIADPPQNTHLRYSLLVSYETLLKGENWLTNWGSNGLGTYVVLKDKADVDKVNAGLEAIIDKYRGEDDNLQMYIQALTDIHLHSDHIKYDLNPYKGNLATVNVFTFIAIGVLLLACINFMNLSTAKSMSRAREVGLRKTVGAGRNQLMFQFLGESIIISLLSFIPAIILIEMAAPWFKELSMYDISNLFIDNKSVFVLFFAATILVGIISGSYPALVLSRFKPIKVLRGKLESTVQGIILRKTLVIFQFVISILLIIGTIVVGKQLFFMKNSPLGFDKENVIVFSVSDENAAATAKLISEKIKSIPGVINSSISMQVPGQGRSQHSIVPEGFENDQSFTMNINFVNENYIETLGMKIVQGSNFNPELKTTTDGFLLNEAAVRAIGWENPIGKLIHYNDLDRQVVGVIKDYNFYSLHREIEPLIVRYAEQDYWSNMNVAVRVQSGKHETFLAEAEKIWQEMIPRYPFEFEFLDQSINDIYHNEERVGKLMIVFSSLAIIIACLGIFGLAAFAVEKRTREVGIRKVLGATSAQLLYLLTSDFIKLVLVSSVLASIGGYFLMKNWLNQFAYHTDLSTWVFIIASLIALLVAMLTASGHALKATNTNPVKTLRHD